MCERCALDMLTHNTYHDSYNTIYIAISTNMVCCDMTCTYIPCIVLGKKLCAFVEILFLKV